MKHVALGDLFTEEELKKARQLKEAKEICEQIVKPKMGHINKITGQENDTMYVSYFLEYTLSKE